MHECPECYRQQDYSFYCEGCDSYSEYHEPDQEYHTCIQCEDWAPTDSDHSIYEGQIISISNLDFRGFGCNNNHDFFEPELRNCMKGTPYDGQVWLNSSIFMECPSCAKISLPAPQYRWNGGVEQTADGIHAKWSERDRGAYDSRVPGYARSRCGFCGFRLEGNYDCLRAPFILILGCLHERCTDTNTDGELEHLTTFFDFSGNGLNLTKSGPQILCVGRKDGLWYYQTKCWNCENWLFFSSDFDIESENKVSWHEVPERFYPSDLAYWDIDDDEWGCENEYDGYEQYPNEPDDFRRSTQFIERLPQHLRQISEIPPLANQHDFSKSDFDKTDFSKKDFNKSGGM